MKKFYRLLWPEGDTLHLWMAEIHGLRQRRKNAYLVSLKSANRNTNILARWNLSFALSLPLQKKKSSLQWGLKKCKDTWTLRQGPLVLSTKSWPGFVMQTFDALWYISISSKRTSEKQKLYVLFWNPAKKMHSLRHCIQMSFPRSSWMLAQTEFIYQGETRDSAPLPTFLINMSHWHCPK